MMAGNKRFVDEPEKSIYSPTICRVSWIREESPEITTFRLDFEDRKVAESFTFKPGNFVLVSVFSHGEAPFAISSPPSQKESIEVSVKRAGRLTQALHEIDLGDRVGVRGPYGNSFIASDLTGKNLLFIAGGIGIAPLRSLISHVLEQRENYGRITILFGARSFLEVPYRGEFRSWGKVKGVDVIMTVDPGGETLGWDGRVGYLPDILLNLDVSSENCSAFVCGPRIVIKLSAEILSRKGFGDSDIFLTLENRMKCGIGKCGRCNIGSIYVCKHGPVFTYKEIKKMPQSDY